MGELNRYDVDGSIRKFNVNVFIETGTGIGVGLNYALQFPFQKLYTIEIMKELYDKNIINIKDKRVTQINDESIKALETIMNELEDNDKVLFWLDAHFPGADFKIGDHDYDEDMEKSLKLPLSVELETIKKIRPDKQDVFIIDDLNLYEDGPYELGNIPDRYRYFREKYDLHGIKFIEDLFIETHTITKCYKHQGFIFVEPKI